MSKHTPGPWKLVNAIDTWMIAACGDGIIIQSPPLRGDSIGTAEADARLIAAAPEMLEALKLALQSCPCTVKQRMSGHMLDCPSTQIEAVIAKAEGKS